MKYGNTFVQPEDTRFPPSPTYGKEAGSASLHPYTRSRLARKFCGNSEAAVLREQVGAPQAVGLLPRLCQRHITRQASSELVAPKWKKSEAVRLPSGSDGSQVRSMAGVVAVVALILSQERGGLLLS